MTVISSLVMICIYHLPQPLQFPEKLLASGEEAVRLQTKARTEPCWRLEGLTRRANKMSEVS